MMVGDDMPCRDLEERQLTVTMFRIKLWFSAGERFGENVPQLGILKSEIFSYTLLMISFAQM